MYRGSLYGSLSTQICSRTDNCGTGHSIKFIKLHQSITSSQSTKTSVERMYNTKTATSFPSRKEDSKISSALNSLHKDPSLEQAPHCENSIKIYSSTLDPRNCYRILQSQPRSTLPDSRQANDVPDERSSKGGNANIPSSRITVEKPSDLRRSPRLMGQAQLSFETVGSIKKQKIFPAISSMRHLNTSDNKTFQLRPDAPEFVPKNQREQETSISQDYPSTMLHSTMSLTNASSHSRAPATGFFPMHTSLPYRGGPPPTSQFHTRDPRIGIADQFRALNDSETIGNLEHHSQKSDSHPTTELWEYLESISSKATTTTSVRQEPTKSKDCKVQSGPLSRVGTSKPPAPTAEYLLQASEPAQTLQQPQTLLLVLDLNGTLLDKSRKGQGFQPRPYLNKFLKYCLRNHRVMIWSSARPVNVRKICNKIFTDADRKQLVELWDRDKLDLSPADYQEKVQVYKRLDKVWEDETVQKSHPAYEKRKRWNQENTILIDDNILKASAQPDNLIEIPEFEKGQIDQERKDLVLARIVEYLEDVRWYQDVSTCINKHPFRFRKSTKPRGNSTDETSNSKVSIAA